LDTFSSKSFQISSIGLFKIKPLNYMRFGNLQQQTHPINFMLKRSFAVELERENLVSNSQTKGEIEMKEIQNALGENKTGHLMQLHGSNNRWVNLGLKLFGYYSKKAILIKNSQVLYEFICEQAERIEFYENYGFKKDFGGWYMLTLLHLWMVYVRLRLEGHEGYKYQQLIFNAFWIDVESRMLNLGIDNPIALSSEQKKLANVYYGFMVGLDEGLVEGDPVLVDALWRNMWKMEDTCTPQRLHGLLTYIRRELQSLDKSEGRLLFGGLVRWGEPIAISQ